MRFKPFYFGLLLTWLAFAVPISYGQEGASVSSLTAGSPAAVPAPFNQTPSTAIAPQSLSTPVPVIATPGSIIPQDSPGQTTAPEPATQPIAPTENQPAMDKTSDTVVDTSDMDALDESPLEGLTSQGMKMPVLKRFGRGYFEPALKRISEMKKRMAGGQPPLPTGDPKDSFLGFVGPMDMATSSASAIIPQRYVLSPGDQVTVLYWGRMMDLQKLTLAVDDRGEVTVSPIGKMVVRGMNLEQFQTALRTALERVTVKDLELIATLDRLKSIQVFITGAAFYPGSYAINSATTLFNALYASGGPTIRGSLRDVRLLRNQQTIHVDFYQYLLHGDSQNDMPLQAGDTIFIPLAERSAAISGEVVRPAIYELRKGETLKDLVALAGGLKPTAILEKILIRSLTPNKEHLIREVNYQGDPASQDTPLYEGDAVLVSAILPEIVNMVTLEGNVERPGVYTLTPEMRVTDLFSDNNHPLGDAALERADIVRLNEDGRTTKLIPIHLGKALQKDPAQNVKLAWMDRVIVYSKYDVAFIPPRRVTILGAVQRTGEYERSDGMTIKDLLVKAGGVMPNASLDRADLLRYDFEKEITTILPINIGKVLTGEKAANVTLSDRDLLRIYTIQESQFVPPHKVAILGAVQRAGDYERSDGMTIKDLLVKAGGVMPNVSLDRADLLRYDFEKEITTIIPVNLGKALAGDASANITLSDRDTVRIFSNQDTQFTPPHIVTIYGAVQRPDKYPRSEGMRLKDLFIAAGGPLPGYFEKIEVARARSLGEAKIISVDLQKLLQGDDTQNIPLEDEDVVMVKKKSEFFDRPIFVTIQGEVKYPGTYPLRTRTEKMSDLLKKAGGLTDLAYTKGAVFTRKRENIPSPEQRSDLRVVNNVINLVNVLDYERQLARNQFLLLEARENTVQSTTTGATPTPMVSGGSAAEAAAIGMAPATGQATGQTVGGIIGTMEPLPAVVSKPRRLGDDDFQPTERVIVSLPDAVSHHGGKSDLTLMEGDTLKIPTEPMTVDILGAVMRPTVASYDSKKKVDHYVRMAGGYAADADPEKALVLRVDGAILPAEHVKKIEPGDMLYVPPKVMSLEVKERIDKIIDVVKFTLVTASSVGMFIFLVGLFVP